MIDFEGPGPHKFKLKQLPRQDPREKVIEGRVCSYARKYHGYAAYKFVSPGTNAVLDRLMVNRYGWHCFVEFKRKGQVPTKQQEREIEQLEKRGCYVFIVDNYKAGKALVNACSELRREEGPPWGILDYLGVIPKTNP